MPVLPTARRRHPNLIWTGGLIALAFTSPGALTAQSSSAEEVDSVRFQVDGVTVTATRSQRPIFFTPVAAATWRRRSAAVIRGSVPSAGEAEAWRSGWVPRGFSCSRCPESVCHKSKSIPTEADKRPEVRGSSMPP